MSGTSWERRKIFCFYYKNRNTSNHGNNLCLWKNEQFSYKSDQKTKWVCSYKTANPASPLSRCVTSPWQPVSTASAQWCCWWAGQGAQPRAQLGVGLPPSALQHKEGWGAWNADEHKLRRWQYPFSLPFLSLLSDLSRWAHSDTSGGLQSQTPFSKKMSLMLPMPPQIYLTEGQTTDIQAPNVLRPSFSTALPATRKKSCKSLTTSMA